ncbi:MAG TPA: tryptophan synthase subunit alpha [Pyrinomonadaceae bacterium]|nr:tryptophan synthase subunit alpha [Pyrinomonadaceae bacterium]
MGRIDDTFARLKRGGKGGFIPFITAGDPDLAATVQLMVELANAGADVIELGVPFSDPMADGPVIQRASERALKHNFGLDKILEVVVAARTTIQTPIVLFSYYNPLLQYGVKALARDARQAGVDGVLVTDLIPEEAEEFAAALKANDLNMIFLVAPTSTDDRLSKIATYASGFVYAVSRTGVTGARKNLSDEAELLVRRVRKFSDLPVAVGFGISDAAQVQQTLTYADAAVVGSAIVSQIELSSGRPDLVAEVGQFVRNLVSPEAIRA